MMTFAQSIRSFSIYWFIKAFTSLQFVYSFSNVLKNNVCIRYSVHVVYIMYCWALNSLTAVKKKLFSKNNKGRLGAESESLYHLYRNIKHPDVAWENTNFERTSIRCGNRLWSAVQNKRFCSVSGWQAKQLTYCTAIIIMVYYSLHIIIIIIIV